jgi:hypothetical protein
MRAFNNENLFHTTTSEYVGKRFFKDFPFVCSAYDQNYAIMFYKNLNPFYVISEKVNILSV